MSESNSISTKLAHQFRTFDPDQPLFFSHIPKTAGNSVRNVFSNWYDENLILHYYGETIVENPTVKIAPLDNVSRSNKVCVFGHFINKKSTGFNDCYPQASQFATCYRNPLDIAVSTYYYVQREAANWVKKPALFFQTLEEYMETAGVNINNYLKTQVDNTNFRQVLSEEYVYIGLVETLDQDMINLASILGFEAPAKLEKLNAGPKYDSDLASDLIEKFVDRHQLEYAIYEWLKELRS